jgi:hypothetical protein
LFLSHKPGALKSFQSKPKRLKMTALDKSPFDQKVRQVSLSVAVYFTMCFIPGKRLQETSLLHVNDGEYNQGLWYCRIRSKYFSVITTISATWSLQFVYHERVVFTFRVILNQLFPPQ